MSNAKANATVNANTASSTEVILNRVSMILLVAGGIFFIYEGATLVEMRRDTPDRIPAKVGVAGSLTIFLGILSIAFAVAHLFFDGTIAAFLQKMQQKPKGSNAANATKAVGTNGSKVGSINANANANANALKRLNAR